MSTGRRRSECDGRRGADGVSGRSEKAARGEGDGFPVADDEVVDEAHVDERERFGEALGDGAVGEAGLDADEPEELVAVEGGGFRALHARRAAFRRTAAALRRRPHRVRRSRSGRRGQAGYRSA